MRKAAHCGSSGSAAMLVTPVAAYASSWTSMSCRSSAAVLRRPADLDGFASDITSWVCFSCFLLYYFTQGDLNYFNLNQEAGRVSCCRAKQESVLCGAAL